jgi:hypothetical protein
MNVNKWKECWKCKSPRFNPADSPAKSNAL